MIEKRIIIYKIIFPLLFGLILFKLFMVQIKYHEFFDQKAIILTEKAINSKPLRGEIRDRNGILLVTSVKVYRMYIDKLMIKPTKIDSVLTIISKLTGTPVEEYISKVNKDDKKIVYLENELSSEKFLKISEIIDNKIPSIGFEESFKRKYSFDNFASHIIGYVRVDSAGLDGIEKYYDSLLRGIPGVIYYKKDARGKLINPITEKGISPQNGYNLELTIDKEIQLILEEELAWAYENWKANSAIGIIINPNTGEVLALAKYPNFDLQRYYKYSESVRRNDALAVVYDPGSTFKVLTLATALESNIVRLDEIINAEKGIYRLASNNLIRDDHPFERLTVEEALIYSSNIVFAKIGQKIGNDLMYKFILNFGIGNYTGIDLPGEVKGIVTKPNNISLPRIAHGYSISVTPIQMIMLYAAAINGGYVLRPYILSKVYDEQNNIVLENKPTVIRKVISENTSLLIRNVLKKVVEEGTGKNAKISFVECGGKTGTAQKFVQGKGYSKESYVSSFIGFFPVEKPEYLILIKIDSPQGNIYGGQVAAPVFKRVGERIFDLRKSNEIQTKFVNYTKTINKDEIEFPNLIGIDKNTAIDIAKSLRVKYLMKGNGNIVQDQIYDKAKNTITFELSFSDSQGTVGNITMPNLKGLSIREAVTQLKKYNLRFEVIGSGYVLDQNIPPGKVINPGTVVRLNCERGI